MGESEKNGENISVQETTQTSDTIEREISEQRSVEKENKEYSRKIYFSENNKNKSTGIVQNSNKSTGTIQNSKEKYTGLICPRCGSELVIRTAKKGANAGNMFYGCSNFPKCRFVRNIGQPEKED